MKVLDGPRPPKRRLLFATVGATLPFDRLVDAVATLKAKGVIEEDVILQTGIGGVAPPGLASHETLPLETMISTLREADVVVCHGGTGSLITALREGCRVIAMPRSFDNGEHYDDHQSEITSAFARRGLIEVARSVEELETALVTVKSRPPVMATSEPTALIDHLRKLIAAWADSRAHPAASSPAEWRKDGSCQP